MSAESQEACERFSERIADLLQREGTTREHFIGAAQYFALLRIGDALATMCDTMLANQAKMEAEIAEQKAAMAREQRR